MNPKTMQHMKKENRRKPSVFAGFLCFLSKNDALG